MAQLPLSNETNLKYLYILLLLKNWKKPEGTLTFLQKLGGSFDSKMTLDVTPRRLPTGRHDASVEVKERLYTHNQY